MGCLRVRNVDRLARQKLHRIVILGRKPDRHCNAKAERRVRFRRQPGRNGRAKGKGRIGFRCEPDIAGDSGGQLKRLVGLIRNVCRTGHADRALVTGVRVNRHQDAMRELGCFDPNRPAFRAG